MTKNKTIISKGSTTLTTDSLDFVKGSETDYVLNYRADGIYITDGDKTYKLDISKFLEAGKTDGSITEVIDEDKLVYKINGNVAGHATTETAETLIDEIVSDSTLV
jgi:hypothetical protein